MGKKERKVQVTTLNTSGKKVSKAYSHYNLNATDTDIKTFATTMNMLSENKLKKVEYTDRENITDERAPLTVSFSLDAFETTFWQEVKTAYDSTYGALSGKTDSDYGFEMSSIILNDAETSPTVHLTYGEVKTFLAADNPSRAFAELLTTKLAGYGLSMTYDSGTFTVTNTVGGNRIRFDYYGNFGQAFSQKLYTAWTNGVYSDNIKVVKAGGMQTLYQFRVDTEGVSDSYFDW